MLICRLDPCAVSKTTSSMGQKLDLQQLNLRGDKLEMSAVDPTGGFQSDHLFSSEGVSRSPPAVAAFALCLRSDGKPWNVWIRPAGLRVVRSGVGLQSTK